MSDLHAQTVAYARDTMLPPAPPPRRETGAVRWLRANLPAFLPALGRVARRRPLGLARATAMALAQCVRARPRMVSWPKKLYVKELLQAVALSDELLAAGDELAVEVLASQDSKCERCWHWRADVGHDAAHPTLCGRCVSNLYGDGEVRSHA